MAVEASDLEEQNMTQRTVFVYFASNDRKFICSERSTEKVEQK